MRLSILKTHAPALAILAVAALLRVLLLGIKPPHFDEGVNGWFVDQITKTGYYHYDPTNYHGPLHFYALFLSQTLLGRSVWALRLPVVLVSIATVWLILRFDRFVGSGAARFAALAMAVSPAMVFYGRYAIHESWLVAFLVLTTWGVAELWKNGTRKGLWALFAGVAGLIVTKETYVIHLGCFLLAVPCLWLLHRISPPAAAADDSNDHDAAGPARQQWSWRNFGLGAGVAVALIVFFYSGTFLDWSSLKGMYETFAAWFKTGAEGHGHEKPAYNLVLPLGGKEVPVGLQVGRTWIPVNYYWLGLFARYEWPTLAGFVTGLLCVLPRTPVFIRYLSIYAIGALTAYSIIHYKTPWCIVSLLWPFFLTFGYLVDWLKQHLVIRVTAFLSAVALLIGSLWTAVELNFLRFTDEEEPYVYVQTFEDVDKLVAPLKQLAALDPANFHLTGHIMVSSYHPLPWLLGDFTGIGYYEASRSPSPVDADFLLVEESRVEAVERALQGEYFSEPCQLRASQEPSQLYLNADRFREVFPGREPEFKRGPAVSLAQPE